MAPLSTFAVILSHPLAFLKTLVRTIKLITHNYQTFTVIRESDGLEVEMRKPLDPAGPFLPILPLIRNPGLKTYSEVLPRGHKRTPDHKPLPCSIIVHKDFAVPMRDGVKLYCDIYRPGTVLDYTPTLEEKVPIILVYAPYGKQGNSELFLPELPERLGVSKDTYSGYENFEGPDPAYWVEKGYAIVNIDARGSWNSEGNMYFWGNNDTEDGFDIIEFLAKLPWCNGKVGMAGNSWLAISQWFIASSQPPSLAAIAPWEGASDMYRDQSRRGGMPEPTMSHSVGMLCPGHGLQEDQGLMAEKNEMFNSYWEDKRAKLGRITCPAYVVASYSSKLHIQGSYRGWREIASKEKWLRIHNQQEWADWPKYQDDLALFFDFYLKGVDNHWRKTPPVRLSLLRFSPDTPDVIDRALSAYPPPSMSLKTYFLDAATSTCSLAPILKESSASYLAADAKSEIYFDIVFSEYTELAGYPKVKLWMRCHEHDDMDVHVLLGKIDRAGNPVLHVNYSPQLIPRNKLPLINVVQHQGPTGCLRASHRDWAFTGPSYAEPLPSSPDLSAPESDEWDGKRELWHPHTKKKLVPKGELVKLEFTTWPIGVIYEKGEGLRVRISGRDMCFIEAEQLPVNRNQNIGTHILHTGGQFHSSIVLPVLST